MVNLLQQLLPIGVVISNVFAAILLLALIFKRRSSLVHFVGKHAVSLGFLLALGAVIGSLFYSEIIGFEPCVLCWWQRVAIYPLLALFTVAVYKKDRGVFSYVVPLSLIATVISLYHSYVYWGGKSILPCTALGGACSKIYVYAFGYVTIPAMVLSIAVLMLLFAWANKVYQSK